MSFDKSMKLQQVMRQQGEENAIFRGILNRVADGELTEDDWKNHLCPRELDKLPPEEQEAFNELGVKLCTTNDACQKFNIKKLLELNQPIAQIKAVNKGPEASIQPANSAGNLDNIILLAEGAKVMCTSNLAKNLGVVNGKLNLIDKQN